MTFTAAGRPVCDLIHPRRHHTANKRQRRVIRFCKLIIIGLFAIYPVYSQSIKAQCILPAERQFIDAIFNHDFATAASVLKKFDQQQNLIPSSAFYKALGNWVKGAVGNHSEQIKNSLKALTGAVEELEAVHTIENTPESLLAWNLAAVHTARILLNSRQIFAAYHLGKPAIKKLQQYLQGETTPAGRSAAVLALGLYTVYSHAIPNRYEWVRHWINPSGNFHSGRVLIEQSLQHSPHLAPEAARALLLEVPWSGKQICDYQDFSQELSERYPHNPDFSIAYQGILLRCGQPAAALAENRRFISDHKIKSIQGLAADNYAELFQMGKLRGYVELQHLEAIKNENLVSERLKWFRVFALANTLDIIGEEEEARDHYDSIINADSAPKSLRQSAKMRLQFPYAAARKLDAKRVIRLAGCAHLRDQATSKRQSGR